MAKNALIDNPFLNEFFDKGKLQKENLTDFMKLTLANIEAFAKKKDNYDRKGAKAPHKKTIENAYRVAFWIKSNPVSLEHDDLYMSSVGEIVFRWNLGTNQTQSVFCVRETKCDYFIGIISNWEVDFLEGFKEFSDQLLAEQRYVQIQMAAQAALEKRIKLFPKGK